MPLVTGLLKVSLFGFLLLLPIAGYFWMADIIYIFEVLVTSKCPKARMLNLLLQKLWEGTRISSCPTWCLGQKSHSESHVLGYKVEWNVPEQISKSLCLVTSVYFLFELIFNIYWCEIDLQRFVVGVQEFVELCFYICVFFFRFSSHIDYHRELSGVPWAMQKVLVISFKCVSVYLLIPTSCFIIPLHLSPLVTSGLSSKSVSMFLFCTLVQGYQFIDSNYKWYHMIWVFLFIKHDQLIVPSMVLQNAFFHIFMAE